MVGTLAWPIPWRVVVLTGRHVGTLTSLAHILVVEVLIGRLGRHVGNTN